MKKILVFVFPFLLIYSLLLVNVQATLGCAGPGFYLEDDGTGGTTPNDIELIATGYVNEIHHQTPQGWN